MSGKLSVTFSPHIQDRLSLSSMTWHTFAALGPAILAGFYFYGLRAMVVVALAVLSAMLTEAAMQRIMGRPITIKDGTAALTGLLLAMLLPVGVPWWTVIIGAAVAIVLGKQLFGGLGGNPFNAVLVGWVVLRLSWPAAVGQFYETTPLFQGWGALYALDSSELPLGLLKFGDSGTVMEMYDFWPVLLGGIPGGIGSTSVLGLIIGGLFLVARRIVPWRIPAGFLGGMFLFGLICWLCDSQGELYANPIHHIIFGYALIGAFFLAPDSATSPYTGSGALLFGLGAGVLTMIIRYWGSYQDGVVFAILFLNALTPVLDRIHFRSYGRVQAA